MMTISDETLQSWADGRWCDGNPITDIAELARLLLAERRACRFMADVVRAYQGQPIDPQEG